MMTMVLLRWFYNIIGDDDNDIDKKGFKHEYVLLQKTKNRTSSMKHISKNNLLKRKQKHPQVSKI